MKITTMFLNAYALLVTAQRTARRLLELQQALPLVRLGIEQIIERVIVAFLALRLAKRAS
jgi:hypothetical protein